MDAYSENPQVKMALQSCGQIVSGGGSSNKEATPSQLELVQRDVDHTGVSSHPERLSAQT